MVMKARLFRIKMVFQCVECEVVSIAIDDEEDRRGEWHSPGSPEIHSIDFGGNRAIDGGGAIVMVGRSCGGAIGFG